MLEVRELNLFFFSFFVSKINFDRMVLSILLSSAGNREEIAARREESVSQRQKGDRLEVH